MRGFNNPRCFWVLWGAAFWLPINRETFRIHRVWLEIWLRIDPTTCPPLQENWCLRYLLGQFGVTFGGSLLGHFGVTLGGSLHVHTHGSEHDAKVLCGMIFCIFSFYQRGLTTDLCCNQRGERERGEIEREGESAHERAVMI